VNLKRHQERVYISMNSTCDRTEIIKDGGKRHSAYSPSVDTGWQNISGSGPPVI